MYIKIGCHDHELAGEVDVQHLEGLDVFQILLGDALDGDAVNVELIALDESKARRSRWTLEDVQPDLVFLFFLLSVAHEPCLANLRCKR